MEDSLYPVKAQLDLFSAEATEIRKLHSELLGHVRTTVEQAIRIGELLTTVKTGLDHGRWLPWLKANVEFHERTARRYIGVFEKRDQLKSDTVSDLTDAYRLLSGSVRPDKAARDFTEPDLPEGKWRVLYADPPWSYGDQLTEDYGPTRFHYPNMTIDELCALRVSDLAADEAVLFMWVTSPILPESFEVVKAWGFEYKASFIWDKIRHNYGHYNSVRHELLLICTRGSYLPDSKDLADSVQAVERAKHSVKPTDFRVIIEKMYKSKRKLELFAREESPGWTVWGNEI